MRYYVGAVTANAPSEELPPVRGYWSPTTTQSPLHALEMARPGLKSLGLASLKIMNRRDWTRTISEYGQFPQQKYEVREVIGDQRGPRKVVWASSPHEAVEDVDGLLAELPASSPPRIFQVQALAAPIRAMPEQKAEQRTETSLEKVLAAAAGA